MRLILGSASKFKREELEKAGYVFDVLSADIDEKAIRHDDFELLPLLVARAKALALLPKITEPSILVTTDVIAVCNGELREKPVGADEERAWLRSYAIYPVETITGLVVTNTATGERFEGTHKTKIFWRPMGEADIDEIIAKGVVFEAAGGFEESMLVKHGLKMEGTVDSMRGLPLDMLKELLEKAGYLRRG